MNYYNEFDPNAAEWLRELIKLKLIPNGIVDERSITEVHPDDVREFTQCHWFSGIGGWSLALQLAGIPPSQPLWTGSCPCQPFSSAGKQLGTADERHLWPVFAELVRQCRPPIVLGEQVASNAARNNWLPGVRLDLEAMGYSFGAADLCAPCAGEIGEGRIVRGNQATWERVIIGHPHIRQRIYWVANANHRDESGVTGSSREGDATRDKWWGRVVETDSGMPCSTADGLPDTMRRGYQVDVQPVSDGRETQGLRQADVSRSYAAHELLPCRDGKTRRTESGIFPLVDGLPRGVVPSGDPGSPEYANATTEARAMRLKGYGNAIVPDLAAMFIRAAL